MKLVVHAGLNASGNAKSNPVDSNVRVGSTPTTATKKINMKKITLLSETIKIPKETSYSIEDMEKMFGKRIAKAINSEPNKNGRVYKAIITKKMAKICKPWKFWNNDISKAYKNYVGLLYVPWIIVIKPPVITYMCSETNELIKRKIDMSKYIVMNNIDI